MWKLFELLLKTVCFILLVLDSFQWISNPKFTMTSHIRFYHYILIIFICTRFSSFCYHTFAGFVVRFLFRSIAITNIYNSKLFYSFIRIKLPATKTLRKNWRKWHTRNAIAYMKGNKLERMKHILQIQFLILWTNVLRSMCWWLQHIESDDWHLFSIGHVICLWLHDYFQWVKISLHCSKCIVTRANSNIQPIGINRL